MSLSQFFLDNQALSLESEEQFVLRLSDEDLKHARVLRLQPGEHIAVVDAVKDYFECEIVSFETAALKVRIACHVEDDNGNPEILLVQGLAKGDKMDTIIRHATELGVSAFIPLACERSIVKLDEKKALGKTQRWQSIAKSAAMQSGQRVVPEVTNPKSLVETCALIAQATAILICWEEAPETAQLHDALTRSLSSCTCHPEDARIAIVIGPEGGLTKKEVDTLLSCSNRSHLITLGPSILRTETAAIVAPAIVLHELRNMMRSTLVSQDFEV